MAAKTNARQLKYLVSDYITKLYNSEDEAVSVIADLIDDLHQNKNMTVNYIINQTEIERLICRFFSLLQTSTPMIVGNTAYILGTIAEFEHGRSKIIQTLSLNHCDKLNYFDLLLSLLDNVDSETILNVTGTIGSLVENVDGRHFILSKTNSFSSLLPKVTRLLTSVDLWIASNAALIIARISIDEVGNSFILTSPLLEKIIINLINCLTIDSAGRGMNAAFALGRIFDNELTIEKFHSLVYKMRFVEKLVSMTEDCERAFIKNSCFCLSSVMGTEKGFEIVMSDSLFKQLVWNLDKLLLLDDDETVWFSILTLKIISKKTPGCKLLRKTEIAIRIKACLDNSNLSEETKKECNVILDYLSPLQPPSKPNATLISPNEVLVTWDYPVPLNHFKIKSFLYCKQDDDDILVYRGGKKETTIKNLDSCKKYEFYLKFANDIEMTTSSECFPIVTAEDYPSEPQNLHVLACTSTQIKIEWDEPEKMNGIIKHYIIYTIPKSEEMLRFRFSRTKKNFQQTTDKSSIISGLQPDTTYLFTVYAVNSCGKGAAAEIEASTLKAGAHAPDRPNVIILGRSEANLIWNPPEAVLGKIFRYEVKMNQKSIIYSGANTYCKITNLRSDTEYAFSVIVVTSEGKYESPVCKKRTGKDEYTGTNRAPLYEKKVKPEIVEKNSSSVNVLTNNKIQNNSSVINRRNSEMGENLKSNQPKNKSNSTRLSVGNVQNVEYRKPTLLTNIIDSPSKVFQQGKSKSVLTKSWSGTLSTMDSYTNSISIASTSTSINLPVKNLRKPRDTFFTNPKFKDLIEKSQLEIHCYSDYVGPVKKEPNYRCQFPDVSLKNTNNFFKVPVKNVYCKTNGFNLQNDYPMH